MTRDNIFGMKAIVGIVLMLNLVCVPFTNAALAERNAEPMPYMPETVPAWSFGSAEDGAGVAEVAAGVMGVVGVVGVGAEMQPEFDDPAIQELLDFHVLAFETVFGRAYDGEESAYFFEQPLDESTYATVVPGWNVAGEPVDALVLLAQPIDVTDFADPGNGVTVISAAYIAGTLEGVDKQGFWGISMVYDFSDGVRYNDLLLLSELDADTEEAFMIWAGLLEYDYGRGDPDEIQACIDAAESAYDNCMENAQTVNAGCIAIALITTAGCFARCLITAPFPGLGLFLATACAAVCSIGGIVLLLACQVKLVVDVKVCLNNLRADLAGCGITIARANWQSSLQHYASGCSAGIVTYRLKPSNASGGC